MEHIIKFALFAFHSIEMHLPCFTCKRQNKDRDFTRFP